MKKLAIIGASGFVGSAFIERLFFDKKLNNHYDFTAFINSTGNAARINRLPIKIAQLDLLNLSSVKKTIKNYDCVVNCSRGGDFFMINGLRNLTKAIKVNNIKKFIHLSSMAIYGSIPSPDSKTENGKIKVVPNTYGYIKAKQDEMVFQLHDSGVDSIILCPSNIGGPFSPFLSGIINKIKSGEVLTVYKGSNPTNIIHVDNLVQAILTALDAKDGWGDRYFVNELEHYNWLQLFKDLAGFLKLHIKIKDINPDIVIQYIEESNSQTKVRFIDNFRIAASGEFRSCLSMLPIFDKINKFASNTFQNFSPKTQNKIRNKLEKPIVISKNSEFNIKDPLLSVQVRQIYHSPQKIISKLGYKPLLSKNERDLSTKEWLKFVS